MTLNDMMASSNGNIFRVTGPLCGEFTGPSEFPAHRPVTRSFDVFFDLLLNKQLSKQSWGWWFEMLLRPLWRHCNDSLCYRLWRHFTKDLSSSQISNKWQDVGLKLASQLIRHNSLAPGISGWNFRCIISKHILLSDIFSIFSWNCECQGTSWW